MRGKRGMRDKRDKRDKRGKRNIGTVSPHFSAFRQEASEVRG
jgi:hypothetical protein